jgi:hypothetical protein
MLLGLLIAATLSVAPAHAEPDAPRAGNRLSKRAELRYQDVLTTRGGSIWRGKLVDRGDVYRIRLDDNSEVAVPKAEVASVTRELHPGYPHKGQWDVRVAAGAELAFISATQNAGIQAGPYVELALGHNFGGAFEPELVVVLSPIGPEETSITPEVGVGARYYLQPFKRVKPFTTTQVILYGLQGDLGLRTGAGFLLDASPNIGVGVSQGVTLMSQESADHDFAAGIGYFVTAQAQARF